MTATVRTVCAGCGVTFDQPDDPGRKRRYHDNACRQRAYRQRGGRASGTRQESAQHRQRREESEAWAREKARQERERERSQRRRGRGEEQLPIPEWCRRRYSDDAATAKKRATCEALYKRAVHEGTPVHEARECRKKADSLRIIYGL